MTTPRPRRLLPPPLLLVLALLLVLECLTSPSTSTSRSASTRDHTAAPPLTLEQYHTALRRARSVAVTALQENLRLPQWAPTTRSRIAAALPLQARVQMPTGVVSVDNRSLGQALARALGQPRPAARPAGLRQFVDALDQLLVATAPASLVPDRGRADQALREVLSRPEYRSREPGASWFDRFLAWLDRVLERWLPHSSRAPGSHNRGLGRVLVAVVVLLLAVLIARIILTVLPDLRAPRRREADQPGGELMLPQEPEALLAEAEREATAGRYREALRLIYRAMVARLDRAGVLPEDRSRTHWELLRDLRRLTADGSRMTNDEQASSSSSLVTRHSSLLAVFAPITRRLDERLYGGRAATAEDYQDYRRAHDQIERLLCAPA